MCRGARPANPVERVESRRAGTINSKERMNKNTDKKPTTKKATKAAAARISGGAGMRLASMAWDAARQAEMSYVDIVECCAVLQHEVARKSGEPIESVLNMVKRRIPA